MVWEDVLQENTMDFIDAHKAGIKPEIFNENNLPF